MTPTPTINALAWLADGQIVVRTEPGGQEVVTLDAARALAATYARHAADADVTGSALDHITRWMRELEAAIFRTTDARVAA